MTLHGAHKSGHKRSAKSGGGHPSRTRSAGVNKGFPKRTKSAQSMPRGRAAAAPKKPRPMKGGKK